ncbi:MAG: metalloregulator ArsR/SmtB family transcription factor [Chloroflexota bacterium]
MSEVRIEPATLFAALADKTRFRLVEVLARQPRGGALCVGALARRLGISQPAVSQHLQVLRSVGLVYSVRRGPRVHYYLDRERLLLGQLFLQELTATVVEGGGTEREEAEAPDPCAGSELCS